MQHTYAQGLRVATLRLRLVRVVPAPLVLPPAVCPPSLLVATSGPMVRSSATLYGGTLPCMLARLCARVRQPCLRAVSVRPSRSRLMCALSPAGSPTHPLACLSDCPSTPARPPARSLRARPSAVSACWAFARCARGRCVYRASWRHGDCALRLPHSPIRPIPSLMHPWSGRRPCLCAGLMPCAFTVNVCSVCPDLPTIPHARS
ncbi:uncharacterized protein B0H18DRAFT_486526 [Fomitopsis serialis]|uniref:uncharacterized protein n=1 Tax=Fomitopsis serialis TaxID=139415 RepID=UPI002007A06F|nr:uncharacterized protein B0H18DRAFT_486526 [Neoantrodia serialis]KAH9934746.1 hypothetical protein B0H18DRAFT_486526 [Neoantrodia serialis]